RERRLEADPAYKQAQQELSDYYAKLHEARQEFGGDVEAAQETAKIKAVKEKFTQAGGAKWSPRPGEDVGVKIDTGLVKEPENAQEGGSQTQKAG
ncbi:hypothetical protein LRR18_18490, partial [Mangrovimonas sp. AS39]|uniref:hypothetical protein n=1 Tax=Mangrovimonas futianensis TaxID=2895523 RepID=UPI001E41D9CF